MGADGVIKPNNSAPSDKIDNKVVEIFNLRGTSGKVDIENLNDEKFTATIGTETRLDDFIQTDWHFH